MGFWDNQSNTLLFFKSYVKHFVLLSLKGKGHLASMPDKISAQRLGIKWMQIHTQIISIFSSTPPGSAQESKNIPSLDIIHLSGSKELFLISLPLFSLRFCRSPPTPPAIFILTSLSFPGLIASRIQPTFCRRKNMFVKISLQTGTRVGGEKKKKKRQKDRRENGRENNLPSSLHKYRQILARRTNLVSPLCHTNSVKWYVEKVISNNLTMTS